MMPSGFVYVEIACWSGPVWKTLSAVALGWRRLIGVYCSALVQESAPLRGKLPAEVTSTVRYCLSGTALVWLPDSAAVCN